MLQKMSELRKLIFSIFILLIFASALFPTFSYAESDSLYGSYDSFEDLYDEYMEAIDSGDSEKMCMLEELAKESLQKEIELSEQLEKISNSVPDYFSEEHIMRIDPDEAYYLQKFWQFFSAGYWEVRSGERCLTLHNKKSYWSGADKSLGWTCTRTKFGKSAYWYNTSCMKEQFYCHARLGYAAVESEWNLEPHKTSINFITCN